MRGVAQAFQPAGLATFQSPVAELENSAHQQTGMSALQMLTPGTPSATSAFGLKGSVLIIAYFYTSQARHIVADNKN
jgi:hypothetical protein